MTDTIAAAATAMTASGIGIIRMSGPDSREIAGKIYRSKGGKKKIEEVIEKSKNFYDKEEVTNLLIDLLYE